MQKRIIKVIIITAVIIIIGCSLLFTLRYFKIYLPCVVRFATLGHIKCPSCGATRATISLLSGDINTAIKYNLMIFVIWLYIIRSYIKIAYGYIQNGYIQQYKISLVDILMVIIMVVWAIFRNILGL